MKKYLYHIGRVNHYEFIEAKPGFYSLYDAKLPKDLVERYQEAYSEFKALEEAIEQAIVEDSVLK